MASSEHFPNIYAATSAPPPTPSSHPNNHHHPTSPAAVDALSRLLHRLPAPSLSLPTRCSSLSTSLIPTVSDLTSGDDDQLLSASSQLGFFQLTNHNIASDLANSAESEARSLFELSREQKESYFPRNWPLGFEEHEDGNGESFWLDDTVSCESAELSLLSLHELRRDMDKIGREIIEMLAGAVGFENSFKEDPTRMCSLMVVHEGDKPVISGGCYPYVVGLHYVIRSGKCSLLADSGWVSVQPKPDSVMVTLGDIAQVWSNGKLKKVRGRPLRSYSKCISITLLVSLPTEATVSPLLPNLDFEQQEDSEEENIENDNNIEQKEKRLFKSFSFEDNAWRVYHEPLLFKDPLDKFHI